VDIPEPQPAVPAPQPAVPAPAPPAVPHPDHPMGGHPPAPIPAVPPPHPTHDPHFPYPVPGPPEPYLPEFEDHDDGEWFEDFLNEDFRQPNLPPNAELKNGNIQPGSMPNTNNMLPPSPNANIPNTYMPPSNNIPNSPATNNIPPTNMPPSTLPNANVPRTDIPIASPSSPSALPNVPPPSSTPEAIPPPADASDFVPPVLLPGDDAGYLPPFVDDNDEALVPPVDDVLEDILIEYAEPPVEETSGLPGIPNKTPANITAVTVDPDVLNGLPKEDCITEEGAIGECYTADLCNYLGGKPYGSCHQGLDYYGDMRSCCVFNSYCGYETNKELTYLMNPEYPASTESVDDCMFKVDLLPGVCQLRLDFLDLVLKPMEDGVCDDNNALHISSPNPFTKIPVNKLCGNINQAPDDVLRTDIPHLYVHVDRDDPALYGVPDRRPPNKRSNTVKLNIRVKDFASRWNIRVSQISCDGANLQAPMGCAQYYNSNSGNISSLNFNDGAYARNLSLAACIKRDPTACAIEYNVRHMGVGETKGVADKLGYGLTCTDYLLIGGERTALCGGIHAAKRMVFPTHGPEFIFFQSDDKFINKVDVGYDIEYAHIQDCSETEFFKYPTKKMDS